jgi:hypothetical protein
VVEGRWRSWWWDAGLVGATALTTWLTAAGAFERMDLAIHAWCVDHDPAWARRLADIVNHFGQGWVLTYVLTGGLTLLALILTRSWRVLLPGIAAYLIAGVATYPLKVWTQRDAPSSDLPPDVSVQMFNDAAVRYSKSFPSGHIINTLVWWPAIVLLLGVVLWHWNKTAPAGLRRFLLIAPPIIVFGTTIYLSYHWFTDDLAAVFLGLFLARVFWRLPWDRLAPFSVSAQQAQEMRDR